jgi:hypothetical protein
MLKDDLTGLAKERADDAPANPAARLPLANRGNSTRFVVHPRPSSVTYPIAAIVSIVPGVSGRG